MTDGPNWQLVEERLQAVAGARAIQELVLPVARFVLERQSGRDSPFFLGLSGPQGAGKSTLASQLVHAFAALGRAAVAISIDDFYLTHDAQVALAAAHPGNPYLEHRGYPGTHDLGLGEGVLAALARHESLVLPHYDKSANGGRGDRAARSAWTRVDAGVDLVILEGWMLGFSPVPVEALTDRHLEAPNRLLADYTKWTRFLGANVLLLAPSLDTIVAWRVQAERDRRHRDGRGLTDVEARDYIERFLPAYRIYVPPLIARLVGEGARLLRLDASRLPSP